MNVTKQKQINVSCVALKTIKRARLTARVGRWIAGPLVVGWVGELN